MILSFAFRTEIPKKIPPNRSMNALFFSMSTQGIAANFFDFINKITKSQGLFLLFTGTKK